MLSQGGYFLEIPSRSGSGSGSESESDRERGLSLPIKAQYKEWCVHKDLAIVLY